MAKNIQTLGPDIRRLVMSGYTADVNTHQGMLDPGVLFMQKPFTMKNLAAVLRMTIGKG